MGTRADFYVGRGDTAEWLGSIAYDGDPEGIDQLILVCRTETAFRYAVADFLKGRIDRTLAADGWPWPWNTSHTTDFAYAFDGGATHASFFGGAWFDPLKWKDLIDDENKQRVEFPDMSKGKQRAELFGAHSGVILIG